MAFLVSIYFGSTMTLPVSRRRKRIRSLSMMSAKTRLEELKSEFLNTLIFIVEDINRY
jgi:hypothetical protein